MATAAAGGRWVLLDCRRWSGRWAPVGGGRDRPVGWAGRDPRQLNLGRRVLEWRHKVALKFLVASGVASADKTL